MPINHLFYYCFFSDFVFFRRLYRFCQNALNRSSLLHVACIIGYVNKCNQQTLILKIYLQGQLRQDLGVRKSRGHQLPKPHKRERPRLRNRREILWRNIFLALKGLCLGSCKWFNFCLYMLVGLVLSR